MQPHADTGTTFRMTPTGGHAHARISSPWPTGQPLPAARAPERADAPPREAPAPDGLDVFAVVARFVGGLTLFGILRALADAPGSLGGAWHHLHHPALGGAWFGVQWPRAALFFNVPPRGLAVVDVLARVNDRAMVGAFLRLDEAARAVAPVAGLDNLARVARQVADGEGWLEFTGPGIAETLGQGAVVRAEDLARVTAGVRAAGYAQDPRLFDVRDGDETRHLALAGGGWVALFETAAGVPGPDPVLVELEGR